MYRAKRVRTYNLCLIETTKVNDAVLVICKALQRSIQIKISITL